MAEKRHKTNFSLILSSVVLLIISTMILSSCGNDKPKSKKTMDTKPMSIKQFDTPPLSLIHI